MDKDVFFKKILNAQKGRHAIFNNWLGKKVLKRGDTIKFYPLKFFEGD